MLVVCAYASIHFDSNHLWFIATDRTYVEELIADAVAEWEERSCVSFPERTTESNYVLIIQGTGCSSLIGDSNANGPQNMALAFASSSNPQCVNVSRNRTSICTIASRLKM